MYHNDAWKGGGGLSLGASACAVDRFSEAVLIRGNWEFALWIISPVRGKTSFGPFLIPRVSVCVFFSFFSGLLGKERGLGNLGK